MSEYSPQEENGPQTEYEEPNEANEMQRDDVSRYTREQRQEPTRQEDYTTGGNMNGASRNAKLFELREELLQLKIDPETADQVPRLQADITALEKASQKVDEAVEAYDEAYDDLLKQTGSLKTYAQQKLGLVEDATDPGTLDDIKAKVVEVVDDRLERWESKKDEKEATSSLQLVENLPKSVQHAQVQFDNAQEKLEECQQDFNELVGLQKSINDRLKAAQDLKKSIEAEEEKSEPEKWYVMYFHLNDLQDSLDGVNDDLKDYGPADGSGETFAQALEDAWSKLYDVREVLREAEETLSNRQSELATFKANLDEFSSNRKQLISQVISGMV